MGLSKPLSPTIVVFWTQLGKKTLEGTNFAAKEYVLSFLKKDSMFVYIFFFTLILCEFRFNFNLIDLILGILVGLLY